MIRFALWNIFEIVLMLIAMASVILLSIKHIPRVRNSSKRERKTRSEIPDLTLVPALDCGRGRPNHLRERGGWASHHFTTPSITALNPPESGPPKAPD